MLIANSNLVGRWATWDVFRELERQGLTMYGQMTAGSWIYIGSQGILQGTYETFGAVARAHFGGSLAGRFVLTAGLGGMGGAQPLAATMNGAAILGIEVDPARIDKRSRRGTATGRPRASTRRSRWIARRKAQRRGAVGGAGRQRRRGAAGARRAAASRPTCSPTRPARTTRSTATSRQGSSLDEAPRAPREPIRRSTSRRANASIVEHVRAMLALQERGAVTFDYGNNIRTVALDAGVADAFDIPGFVPEYVRPLFCEGKGPFRWVALSGDPEDIHRTDELVLELFPDDEHLRALDHARARAGRLPGTAGAHLLAGAGRARAVRRRAQRSRRHAASSRRRSSSAATTSTPAAWRRRSARPKR